MINKLDLALAHFEGEEVYQRMLLIIQQVNAIIVTYGQRTWAIDPRRGNVVFGSSSEQWAFALKHFARFYAHKFKLSEEEMLERLWGNWVLSSGQGQCEWMESDSVNSNGGVDKGTGSKVCCIICCCLLC